MRQCIAIAITLSLLLVSDVRSQTKQAASQPLPRAEWGAPEVTVTRAGDRWTIAGKKQTVTLNASTLALEIKSGPTTWAMVPSGANDMLVKSRGEEFPLRLADAKHIAIEPYDTGFKTGVKITLGDWPHDGQVLDAKLYLTVCLEGKDEDLICDA